MRFELEPYNWGEPDSELIADVLRVARGLGKSFVTRIEYDRKGRFSSTTIQKRFGSWIRAHQLAGLSQIRRFKTTPEECLANLRSVADKLGKRTLTTSEYLLNGGYSLRTLNRHFSSWEAAIERAGLTVSPLYHKRASTEKLFENIERLWESLGRQPRTGDFAEPPSEFSSCTYKRHFGSLRNALEAFVESVQQPELENHDDCKHTAASTPFVTVRRHKTGRTVSYRMRFLVMRRDNFRCKICGQSPANHVGTVLVVDHIVPWDAGGETVLENLQSLCNDCNSGKSNLELTEESSI